MDVSSYFSQPLPHSHPVPTPRELKEQSLPLTERDALVKHQNQGEKGSLAS